MNSKRSALIVGAMLMIPLALFFVPYAYAATTSTDYVVTGSRTIGESIALAVNLECNSGDYAVSGGFKVSFVSDLAVVPAVASSYPTVGGSAATSGQTPNGWAFDLENPTTVSTTFSLWVVCQTPVTVAGIGVPEFGQLYVAIALGAAVFFVLTRYSQKPRSARPANLLPPRSESSFTRQLVIRPGFVVGF